MSQSSSSSSSLSSTSSSSSVRQKCDITFRRGAVIPTSQGYSLRIDVDESICTDKELFVYRRDFARYDAPSRDVFNHIASPADLEEYPIGVPGGDSPFFRLSYIDLVFRDLDLLWSSWLALEMDVHGLVETLNQMEVVEETTMEIE